MRYRTIVKTGRTAAEQREALRPGSFGLYAAMVERISAGYTRSLVERLAARRPAP